MPYRYNEKTGEFEDVPGLEKGRRHPHTPRTATPESGGGSSSDDIHAKIICLLVRLAFYAILGALLSGIIG